MAMTPGFSIEDSAHEQPLFAMPSPPLEIPQSIDLSSIYEDAVHPVYRKYGPSLTQLCVSLILRPVFG